MQTFLDGYVRQHLIGQLQKDEDLTIEHRSDSWIYGRRQCHDGEGSALMHNAADTCRFAPLSVSRPVVARLFAVRGG